MYQEMRTIARYQYKYENAFDAIFKLKAYEKFLAKFLSTHPEYRLESQIEVGEIYTTLTVEILTDAEGSTEDSGSFSF